MMFGFDVVFLEFFSKFVFSCWINYRDNGYLPEEELLQRSCLFHWIR